MERKIPKKLAMELKISREAKINYETLEIKKFSKKFSKWTKIKISNNKVREGIRKIQENEI